MRGVTYGVLTDIGVDTGVVSSMTREVAPSAVLLRITSFLGDAHSHPSNGNDVECQ